MERNRNDVNQANQHEKGVAEMKCKKCTKAKSCQKCEQHINWILKDLMNFMDKYSSEDQRTITKKES